jgi:hypothetical protein
LPQNQWSWTDRPVGEIEFVELDPEGSNRHNYDLRLDNLKDLISADVERKLIMKQVLRGGEERQVVKGARDGINDFFLDQS